jgi:hypothetical protein
MLNPIEKSWLDCIKEQLMAGPLIPVNPNDSYRINVWIKTDNVSSASGISLNILEVGEPGTGFMTWYPNGQVKLIATGGTQNWTKYTALIENMDAAMETIKIYFRMDANVAGSAWFDDVSLTLENKTTYLYDKSSQLKTNFFNLYGNKFRTDFLYDKNGNLIKKQVVVQSSKP